MSKKNPDKVLKKYYGKTIIFTADAEADLNFVAEYNKIGNLSIMVRSLIHKEAEKINKNKKRSLGSEKH